MYSLHFIYRVSCYDVLSDNPVLLPSECQQGTLDFFPLLIVVYKSESPVNALPVPIDIVPYLERSALLGSHELMSFFF